jgi:hypothetical protein
MEQKMQKYHCCATCVHFAVVKETPGVSYRCTRLGYQTEPAYKFDCWDPKEPVKKLMEQKR